MTERTTAGQGVRARLGALFGRRGVRTLGLAAAVTTGARLAGLLSQALLVGRFGASAELDGFLLTLIAPSLIVVPLAGAFELAIPSTYAEARASGDSEARIFRRRVLRFGLVAGSSLGACITLAAPLIVRISGPAADPAVIEVAREIAQIVYVGVGFRAISAAATGLLIGEGRITAPVVARLANPLTLAGVLVLSPTTDIRHIAIASLAGDVIEAAITVGCARWRRPTAGPRGSSSSDSYLHARRALRVVLPSMILVQLVPVVDQAFVSGLGAGALTTFVLAVRLVDAARSVLVIPFIRVAQGRLAEASALRAVDIRNVMSEAVRGGAVLGIVATLGVAVGGPVIVIAAFEHGSFDRDASLATIRVLLAFAPSLVIGVFHSYFGRGLVTLGRASLASWLMLVYVGLNLCLDAILVGPAGATGIALATTIALAVSAILQRRAIREPASSSGQRTDAASA